VSETSSSPTKGLAAVLNKGNRLLVVCSLTMVAGILASLGAGWFEGS